MLSLYLITSIFVSISIFSVTQIKRKEKKERKKRKDKKNLEEGGPCRFPMFSSAANTHFEHETLE